MRKIYFIVLCFIFMSFMESSALAVKCCNWLYDPDWPDPYMYWHTQGNPYYKWQPCYGCGPYPGRCDYYKFQNGYWTINVDPDFENCDTCPQLTTCDGAYYQACDTQGIHNGVIRLIHWSGGGNPPPECQAHYQCTRSDRWLWYWICQPCVNFGN